MSLIQWIDFPQQIDSYGSVVTELEGNNTVPFKIQRVYYIFDTKLGEARGFHAHRNLKQVAICISGKCRMILDNSNERVET